MKIILYKIMEERDLSVRQVSQICKIPKSTLQDIISGKTSPRVATVEQIAKGLKISPLDLFESEYK